MNELPDGWRRTTLGEECQIVSGSTPRTSEPSFWDGDIPWLTPADLSKWNGTYINGGARYITQSGLDSCSARLVPKNTVLMSSRAPIGYTAIANREMCTNQGFKSMLPSETVYPEWLRYFLEHALPEIKAMSSGTTFAEISGKKLGTLPMNLPTLKEQKRIVETLDGHLSRLDKALSDLDHADSQTLVFRRSILNGCISAKFSDSGSAMDHVTQPLHDWRRTTLGEECVIVSGSTPKTNEPTYWDGQIPWLTPADLSKWNGTYIDGGARYITKAGLDSCSARLVPKNTVLMSSRAPIGYTAIANREMCTNQGFKSMLPSETVYPEWLRYFLEHALPEIKSMSSGTTFAEISGKKLGTLPMNLPPIDEQKRIVALLDEQLARLDSTRSSISNQKAWLQSLRRSLLNMAFKGELGTN